MDVFGWNRGWDTFFDSSDEQVDDKVPYIKASQLNNKVISWFLAEQKKLKEKPFFLWLHYMDVHEPYVPERKYIDKIDPSIDVDEEQMMKLFHEVLLKRDISDAHLFGLGNIAQFQGNSLLPLEEYPDEGVFGEAIGKHGSSEEEEPKGVFFYREGDVKIIYGEEDDSWELYDLKEDPKELNNIVDKSPSAESMREKLMPRINWWTSS